MSLILKIFEFLYINFYLEHNYLNWYQHFLISNFDLHNDLFIQLNENFELVPLPDASEYRLILFLLIDEHLMFI